MLNTALTLLDNTIEIALDRKVPKPCIVFRGERNGTELTLTVSDNCGGIEAEPPERIFEPYFTTFFKSKGKGLGLSMARLAVEEHLSGSITVANDGDGAVFTLAIPEAAAEGEAP